MHARADAAPRGAHRALAFIRIVAGAWFLKSIVSKITWTLAGGVVPLPRVSERWINFLPGRLQEYASSNVPDFYREFLTNTAIPNSKLYAQLTAIGEVGVGLSLTFGLLTILGSVGALWLIANYLLASWGGGLNPNGFHILLIACMLAFIAARAGRTWGLDGWLRRRHPDSLLARVPLG